METPFPRKLRLLRKLKRCTQNSLAKALNVSRTTVSAWENRIAEPDLATLKNIRDYLKVSYEDLLDDDYAGRTNLFPSVAVASKTPINDENPCRSRIERTAFFCRGENLTERPQPASASRGVFMTVPTIPRERISSKNFTVCSRLRKAININFSISTSIFMYPIRL